MKKQFLATLFAFICAGSFLVVAPAGAELSPIPQTSWGVQGLLTNTETDNVEAQVFALAQAGSTMYAGGRFTEVTDGETTVTQVALAAFDVETGAWISTFAPVLDGPVYALAASADGSRLFVGGEFDTVNGVATGGLVALDPATGAIDAAWSGRIGGYNVVRDFDIEGSWLYVGGGFTSISSASGGNAAYRAARFDVSTGIQDASWRPLISGGTVWGIAASSDMDRVYLAGSFLQSNGVDTPGSFVAIESTSQNNATGVVAFETNTINPAAQYNFDVEVINGLVFVAGSQHYLQVLNESDLSLEVFHLSSIRGDYQSLTVAGDKVWAGCHCFGGTTLESANGVLWVGPRPDGVSDAPVFHTATNSWLTAFSATTGLHLDNTTPPINTSGEGIWAIAGATDTCLWAGGSVTSAGSTTQYGFTRLCDTSLVDLERPSTPSALSASTPAVDSIDLAWNESTDDFGVAGYVVFDNTSGAVVADVSTNSVQLTGLSQGTHSFFVKAYDAAGNVSWRSNIESETLADDERPSAPTELTAIEVADYAVDLDWAPSTDNVGVAGYQVFDASTDLELHELTTTSLSLITLAPGSYSYYIKAFDTAGNVSWRSGVSTVTVVDPTIDEERPSSPTLLMATVPADDTVDLAWAASTDNFGVTGYEVYDADSDLVITTVIDAEATLPTLTFETHRFYIKAFDAAGNTSWRSNTVTVTLIDSTIDVLRPTPPTAVLATAGPVDSADLSWTPATDNFGVVGYRVYHEATNELIVDVAGTSTVLSGLVEGDYRFYVKAYDAAGNTSYRSNTAAVTIIDTTADTERPSTPTALMVDISDPAAVVMTWTASTDNIGVAGYQLVDDNTGLVVLDSAAPTIDLLALVVGTHVYFVKAYDAAGNTSWRSNVVTFSIA